MSNERISCTILLLFFVLRGPLFGQELPREKPAGKLHEIKIISQSLKGNLLGDPAEQTIAVYLPPSYESSPQKRFPVVYLLHGYGGSSRTWTTDDKYSFNVPSIMDRLIANGKIREMIFVAPSASNSYHGSFYVNSTVTGKWEDYISQDVVSFVDGNYRTLPRASSRGIAGHSMGGFGAVAIGMKLTKVFSAIYAHAPCCLALSDTDEELKNPSPLWRMVGGYTSREQLSAKLDSDETLFANLFVAMSAAFSPNATRKPFYADFPYEEREGKLQLNKGAYEQWKNKTPIHLIDAYKRNLLSLRGLALEYGANEVFDDIRKNTPRFSAALADHGIPHHFEIYAAGTHENKVKERLENYILPFFSQKLDFSNP